MALADLITKTRRRLGDRPRFVRVSNTTNNSTNPVTVNLQTGEGALFPSAGGYVEWDDGTGEGGIVLNVVPEDDEITISRSAYGEALAGHAAGAKLLLAPRFEYFVLADLATDIVDEFWPSIWIPKETTLTYQSTNDYYSPTPDDIAEITYAYQLSAGSRWPLRATFLPAELADNTNFPRGAITIPLGATADNSVIYLSYKAIPTVANLLVRQEGLVVDGVIAKVTIDEEIRHVAPAASSTERRVADGAKLRAGAIAWQQFQERLQRERVRLLVEEVQGPRFRGS